MKLEYFYRFSNLTLPECLDTNTKIMFVLYDWFVIMQMKQVSGLSARRSLNIIKNIIIIITVSIMVILFLFSSLE